MKAAIELAKRISKQLDKNWLPELEEINLHKIFSPVYALQNGNLISMNTAIAYIVFSYDNDSTWLNLKQDRTYNKMQILKGLTNDFSSSFFIDIIENENDTINDVIASYIESQASWKFKHILHQLDFYTKTMKFVNQKTEEERTIDKMNKEGEVKSLTQEYNIDTLAKVNKTKGELLTSALKAREDADRLLTEVKKEFVQIENAVQSDFGFSITEETKINPESWRDFIRHTLPQWKVNKSKIN